MKKVAILQSNYIPWKGYFDLINSVDEFIIYDDMQYTKRDWRNRNKISTPNGTLWLTIPVSVKGKYYQKINETLISEPDWTHKHWETIKHFYGKAEYFKDYKNLLEDFYLSNDETNLSKVNVKLIKIINNILGIDTKISLSSDFALVDGKTQRLLNLCHQAGGGIYLSGSSAKDYFEVDLATQMGINVQWISYSGYSEYKQLNIPFEHKVSIIDLIFNEGQNATKFMNSFN